MQLRHMLCGPLTFAVLATSSAVQLPFWGSPSPPAIGRAAPNPAGALPLKIPLAAAADQPEAQAAESVPEPARFYTVRRGDTLTEIAGRFGATVDSIAEANAIGNPDRIRSGQRLRIPSGNEAKPTTRGSKTGKQRTEVAETALRYRGVPYRYAGMTSRGMDCSGLVARVLRTYGVKAPHNSRALFKLGRRVSRKELRPGDLVFFRTRGRAISHVGIYIGNGQFVHASSGQGEVTTDSLDTGYYAKRLAGARRIF